MRGRTPLVSAGIGLALLAAPASAADQTVHAVEADLYGSNRFSPASVSIQAGESVTWVNSGGQHNVRFEDGQFEMPAAPAAPAGWPSPVRRMFSLAGTYRYYCELHGAPGGIGMSGVVRVAAPGGPPPAGGGPGPPADAGTSVRIERLSAGRGRFCNRRGRRCRRPGVRLRIDLSHAAEVMGTLRRRRLDGRGRARRFGKVGFGKVAAGPRTLRFRRTMSGRRLTRGRYALTLMAGRDTAVVRFRVVR